MARIRIDYAISILVAMGVGAFINFAGGKIVDAAEPDKEKTVYSSTIVGAAADENTPVVFSIEEMMEQERFTFYGPDSVLSIHTFYYDDVYWSIYKLHSGEAVLVDEYYYNAKYVSNSEEEYEWLSDHYKVLPVGCVVKEPLSPGLVQAAAETGLPLSDTSFYVDMHGNFGRYPAETLKASVKVVSVILGIAVFFLVRYIMIASGVFPPLFPLRFLRNWKPFISYYGTIYYDENVPAIAALKKSGNLEGAAYEFSKLTNVDMEEARYAIHIWNDIFGEGIVPGGRSKLV